MSERKRKNGHPEESICEQFAHTSYLGVYPNSSDMNKLCEMPEPKNKNESIGGKIYVKL